MGRTHGEFLTAYHVTPKYNRASIEKLGLIPGEGNVHPDTGKINRGVFGSLTQGGAEEHSHLAEDWGEEPQGGDIYAFTVPVRNAMHDDWTTGTEAIKYPRRVPNKYVERVGHITPEGETHWHKEEECPNGRQ